MRAIVFCALPLVMNCDPKRKPNGEIVDVTQLDAVNQAAARDINTLIHDRLPKLSRCADPVRDLVRRSAPGFGSVPIIVRVLGTRGREIEVQSVSVTPRLPAPYDACMTAAFLGAGPTIATGDYALNVRLHMCVDPRGAP